MHQELLKELSAYLDDESFTCFSDAEYTLDDDDEDNDDDDDLSVFLVSSSLFFLLVQRSHVPEIYSNALSSIRSTLYIC